MDYFAGLDVSVKETSVCIVDDTGKIVREAKGSERTCAALLAVSLRRFNATCARSSASTRAYAIKKDLSAIAAAVAPIAGLNFTYVASPDVAVKIALTGAPPKATSCRYQRPM